MKYMRFQPFPELKTERLILRKLEESDSEVILFLRSDKTINEFIDLPENRKTKTISHAIELIKILNTETENNKTITWGIALNNNPQIIGTICLWNFSDNYKTAEIGYYLSTIFQKKGIMSEAMDKIINFGFTEMNLTKMEAFTHSKNENSKNLLMKNGFQIVEGKKDKNNFSNVVFEIRKASR